MPARSRELAVVVTAEHGGNRVPARLRHQFGDRFRGHEALLASHRGWDPGSLELARRLARRVRGIVPTTLVVATTTRLLVDLNRSATHPRAFGPMLADLPWSARARILWDVYLPHLAAVASAVAEGALAGRRVLHVGVHSFTPVLDGVRRPMDIGLLYDPSRAFERSFCDRWKRALREADASLVVHRNAPYKGTSDGLTTILRRKFGDDVYAGVELEVNQRFPLGDRRTWTATMRTVTTALVEAIRAETSAS